MSVGYQVMHSTLHEAGTNALVCVLRCPDELPCAGLEADTAVRTCTFEILWEELHLLELHLIWSVLPIGPGWLPVEMRGHLAARPHAIPDAALDGIAQLKPKRCPDALVYVSWCPNCIMPPAVKGRVEQDLIGHANALWPRRLTVMMRHHLPVCPVVLAQPAFHGYPHRKAQGWLETALHRALPRFSRGAYTLNSFTLTSRGAQRSSLAHAHQSATHMARAQRSTFSW